MIVIQWNTLNCGIGRWNIIGWKSSVWSEIALLKLKLKLKLKFLRSTFFGFIFYKKICLSQYNFLYT